MLPALLLLPLLKPGMIEKQHAASQRDTRFCNQMLYFIGLGLWDHKVTCDVRRVTRLMVDRVPGHYGAGNGGAENVQQVLTPMRIRVRRPRHVTVLLTRCQGIP
jgi:hypothetical protein